MGSKVWMRVGVLAAVSAMALSLAFAQGTSGDKKTTKKPVMHSSTHKTTKHHHAVKKTTKKVMHHHAAKHKSSTPSKGGTAKTGSGK